MSRAVTAGILAAVLLVSCAEGDLTADAASRLQFRVEAVRRAAENRAPREAQSRLEALSRLVDTLLARGAISEDRALTIVDAIAEVESALGLLPIPESSPEPTMPPSPSPEEDGEEGTGDDGKDKTGKGNTGKGNGNTGNEGHGNG